MTNFSSIGDLSRSFQLRLANATMKSRLDVLTQEVSSGIKSDIPKAVGGDLRYLQQIEGRLQTLTAYKQSINEASARFSGMQDALETMQSLTGSLGTSLLSEAATGTADQLRIRAASGAENFSSMIGALNTEVAGQYLFSGSRIDTAPILSTADMLASIKALVQGLATPGDMVAAIDGWFDAPNGAGGFRDVIYAGNDDAQPKVALAANSLVSSDLTANSQQFRSALKGMAIMAVASDPSFGFDAGALRNLFKSAGERLVEGNTEVILARSGVGMIEATIAQAQTRNAAETSGLQIARLDLISADPYETASALKEAEAGLQSLYALTARLSKLTLTDYLR